MDYVGGLVLMGGSIGERPIWHHWSCFRFDKTLHGFCAAAAVEVRVMTPQIFALQRL